MILVEEEEEERGSRSIRDMEAEWRLLGSRASRGDWRGGAWGRRVSKNNVCMECLMKPTRRL